MRNQDDPYNKEDTTYTGEEGDDLKHQVSKPPSVSGEENPFSGDATDSESPDIDEELEKVGLRGDENGIKPLDIQEDLEDENL